MPSSYQVVLWKQESFMVLRPLQIEFFRNLLESYLLFVARRWLSHRRLSLTSGPAVFHWHTRADRLAERLAIGFLCNIPADRW